MSSRPWIARWAMAIAAALLLAGPAGAFPVVFDGAGGYGVSAATASSVSAAGFPIIQDATVYSASLFGLVIPAPDVLSSTIVASPTVAHPNTAQSRWSVTNTGKTSLDGAWLVFLTPVTYDPAKVGIDLRAGNWALVDVPVGESGDYFYPAVFLGNLDTDETVTFLMNHVVGQALTQQGSTLVLPKYSVGVLQGVPVPEPSTFVLLAAGAALVGVLRRGKD